MIRYEAKVTQKNFCVKISYTSPRSQEEDKIRQHAKRFMRLPVYLMNEKDEFGHSLLTYLSSHKSQSKHQGSEKHTKLRP